METLFSILAQAILFALIGATIVVIDFKLVVPLLVYLRPKENRPEPKDSFGLTARQSARWNFWMASFLAATLLLAFRAMNVLDLTVSTLTLWLVFLGARHVVRWWDNQDKFFSAVGEYVAEGGMEEAVQDGVAKLCEVAKPKPKLLDRVRSFVGGALVGSQKLKRELSEIRAQYAPKEEPPPAAAPAAIPEREVSEEERLRLARERLRSFSSGGSVPEETKREEVTQ